MRKVFILFLTFYLIQKNVFPQFVIFDSTNSGLKDNYCWYVKQNSAGDVWVSTQTLGAFKLSGSVWSNYTKGNSGIGADFITPVAFENGNMTWLGSYSGTGGLSEFNGTNWNVYTTGNSGIASDDIMSIGIDPSGNKWIATRWNGISKFDGTTWTNWNTSNSGLPDNAVYSIECDNQSNIWVGTASHGLCKFDGVSTWVIYDSGNSPLPNNNIYSLRYNTAANSLWIGTYGGVAVLNNGSWTVYNASMANFPASNYIRGITHCYNTGNTYIATGAGGIGRFDGYSWKTYNTGNSNLPSNQIWSVNSGYNNEVWASTWGQGIVKLVDRETGIDRIKNPGNRSSLYPNPNAGEFVLKIDIEMHEGEFQIMNSLGQIITRQKINTGLNEIKTTGLPNGLYEYFILENNLKVDQGKFVVSYK
jgi:ligand-binding sensor domain-containing protein